MDSLQEVKNVATALETFKSKHAGDLCMHAIADLGILILSLKCIFKGGKQQTAKVSRVSYLLKKYNKCQWDDCKRKVPIPQGFVNSREIETLSCSDDLAYRGINIVSCSCPKDLPLSTMATIIWPMGGYCWVDVLWHLQYLCGGTSHFDQYFSQSQWRCVRMLLSELQRNNCGSPSTLKLTHDSCATCIKLVEVGNRPV